MGGNLHSEVDRKTIIENTSVAAQAQLGKREEAGGRSLWGMGAGVSVFLDDSTPTPALESGLWYSPLAMWRGIVRAAHIVSKGVDKSLALIKSQAQHGIRRSWASTK